MLRMVSLIITLANSIYLKKERRKLRQLNETLFRQFCQQNCKVEKFDKIPESTGGSIKLEPWTQISQTRTTT